MLWLFLFVLWQSLSWLAYVAHRGVDVVVVVDDVNVVVIVVVVGC